MLLKILSRLAILLAILYVATCIILYFNQESILFHPKKLAVNHVFKSDVAFEELTLETKDNKKLNGLLFKAKAPKGLVFYVHGNAGNLDGWAGIAATYTDMNYDLLLFDFRGFGKSEGTIQNEAQFLEDVQQFYDLMKTRYKEKDIVILGYSIGTGPAAWLASRNHPKSLLLLAPYYNLADMMHKMYPMVPEFILKYKFTTNEYLNQIQVPVTIFHGKKDQAIYFGSSLKLIKHFKSGDQFFPLENQAHVGMDNNLDYLHQLKILLK